MNSLPKSTADFVQALPVYLSGHFPAENYLFLFQIFHITLRTNAFVFLINDLDLLSNIPEVSTEKPIFTVDLSQAATPNYSYMLLRDEGFSQIFAYAKKRHDEESMATMVRSLTAGLMLFINKSKFSQHGDGFLHNILYLQGECRV